MPGKAILFFHSPSSLPRFLPHQPPSVSVPEALKPARILNFSQTPEHHRVHPPKPSSVPYANSSLAPTPRGLSHRALNSSLLLLPLVSLSPSRRLQRGSLQACHLCQSSKKHIWNHTLHSHPVFEKPLYLPPPTALPFPSLLTHTRGPRRRKNTPITSYKH